MGREELGKIRSRLEENQKILNETLGIDVSFDVIFREISVGDKKAGVLFVDGFIDDEVTTLILQTLLNSSREELVPGTLEKVLTTKIPYVDAETIGTLDEAVHHVLSGPVVVFIDGESRALKVDSRVYPGRDPEEPEIEKITRGSRDGFVETLLFNVTLIRRRLRDPRLRSEPLIVGERSASDVVLVYIEDIANPKLVNNIRSKLQNMNVDALTMAEKTVEEYTTGSYWNPFPEVRYSERPDVAAAHLLEGHVAIVVDTSPSVMIAPVTFFHHLTHAEEFRHDPVMGVYIRWVRVLGVFMSFIIIPLWLLIVLEPGLPPPVLEFLGPEEDYAIPLMFQFIIAHFGVDLLRMASIHTPSPMATALGLVGGLLIGEIAVEVGFFVPEVLLYAGLNAIGIFATPSWELSMANRVIVLFLVILTGLFLFPGFVAGILLVLLRLVTTRSFGFPYLWPLIPFDAAAMFNVIIRRPMPVQKYRSDFLDPLDKTR